MFTLRTSLGCLVGLALTASACAPSPAQEPNKSAPPQPMPAPAYPSHHYSQPQPMPGAVPKPKVIERPVPQSAEEAEEEIAQLMKELDTTLDGVQVESMGDTRCLRSCKALASMRRAVDRLCDLTDGDDRCTRARDRLERSERKVTDAGCSCS